MPHVLIIDPDRPTCRWLSGVLERQQFSVDVVHSGEEGLKKIANPVPQIVVLELGLPDMNGIDLIRRLRQAETTRDAGIIVLSAQMEIAEIQAGLGAGADEYLAKRPGVEADLIAKIHALAARVPVPSAAPSSSDSTGVSASTPSKASSGKGKIIAFSSAKGGTGTTSVCVNTAFALARQSDRLKILVVDMVFPLGTVGRSIGYESPQTISLMSQLYKDKLNSDVIKKFVSPERHFGFNVLLATNTVKQATDLEVSQMVPLFETLREMYDYVLVDFGRALSRISLPIIQRADAIAITLTPDINTVKMTRLVIQHLVSLGIEYHQLVLLYNHVVGSLYISKDEIENELGLALTGTIPHESENMTAAINTGLPFMAKFPSRPASIAFAEFARALVERVTK